MWYFGVILCVFFFEALKGKMLIPTIPRIVAIKAVEQLATVDYTIANRVTEDVSHLVAWSYQHDMPWIAQNAMTLLQTFDNFGSFLITIVVWIVMHTN